MAKRAIITPELCRQLIKYEAETGSFTWLRRPQRFFRSVVDSRRWNSRFAGREAFTSRNGKGYRSGAILGINVDAHLVAWMIATGETPAEQIDHIDGDKANCRLANLRPVTNAENLKNKSLYTNNTSGRVGVHREATRWTAKISVNGVYTRIGSFATFEEAAEARARAENALGYHPNHGRPK